MFGLRNKEIIFSYTQYLGSIFKVLLSAIILQTCKGTHFKIYKRSGHLVHHIFYLQINSSFGGNMVYT